jgi:hypothetical protein
MIRRLDWVDPAPFLQGDTGGPVILRTHPSSNEAPEAEEEKESGEAKEPSSEEPETIHERFERLREELRPRTPEPTLPRPSPLFLGILAVIAGLGSILLLLPSSPATVPLYGQQTEGFEAEPLWDPLLLAPENPKRIGGAPGEPPRTWVPAPRKAELPEDWEKEMQSGSVRAVFSRQSSLVRIESPGCAANVKPLMEFPEVSADGFPVLPWNRASLRAGAATGWQKWNSEPWTVWVRYSGDPWLSGSWPPRARRGLGPWLGKVALQLMPDSEVVGLSAVNRLNLALSARQADLCSVAVEPIREAEVIWGTIPPITDSFGEKSKAWLHRTATGFVRGGHKVLETGEDLPLETVRYPAYHGWLVVRQKDNGPGFLICAPFWQRQIGLDKPTHTPLGDPSNRISVALEGLTAQIRFSFLSPQNAEGSTIATVAPGTYLNVFFLVPLADGEPHQNALDALTEALVLHAPPFLRQETQNLIKLD